MAKKISSETVTNFWAEFKAFALKGNMIDLAVGIIIGAGFNELVQSLVKDIVMPPIGKLLGNVDFSNLYIALTETHYESLQMAEKAGVPVIRYGVFITHLINFLILAFTIFLVLKLILRHVPEEKK